MTSNGSYEPADHSPHPRSSTWRWYICGLLMLATVVNYLDRLTVNLLSPEIQKEFHLLDQDYGTLEFGFGLAFAVGSIFFGWLVDRVGVYWLYPFVLIGWSATGFLTGLSSSFSQFLWLRVVLGFFEAGHFPCGLKTIQLLMAPRDRALGNSLLQGGTALGAVLAPQIIKALIPDETNSSWRLPFLVIGGGGCLWVGFWFASVRTDDVPSSPPKIVKREEEGESFWSIISSWNFVALAVMVVVINLNWHLFRVWLPKFLRQGKLDYDRDTAFNIVSAYYVAATAGTICAGALSGWLARRGMSVYSSRMVVYAGCCALTMLSTAVAFLPPGPLFITALLLVGFGGLGTYSAYYSLTQDLTLTHQGKVSGLLAATSWVASSAFHPVLGWYLDHSEKIDALGNSEKDYTPVIAAIGWLPVLALVAVLLVWRPNNRRT